MRSTWKTLTLYSLLTAATVAYAPQAVQAQELKKEPGIEELNAKILEMQTRLGTLEKKKLPTLDQDVIAEVIKAEFKKIETGALADLKSKLQGVGDDLQGLKRSVDSVNKELDAVKEAQLKQNLQLNRHKNWIDQLAEDVLSLQKKIRVAESSPAVPPLPAVDKTSLEEIRTRLNTIQDALARLSPTEKRLSMSMPNNNGALANTGRVNLVNLYSDDLLFVINGVGYNVPARSSKVLENVPTGSLRYEVFSNRFGVLDVKTTNLTNGETFTVTASR